MTQHYPKSTVSVSAYCQKCKKMTQHRVHDGRLQACEVCLEKPHTAPQPARPAPPAEKQGTLF